MVEHYCDITSSFFLQHMMQSGTRKMLQIWYSMTSLVCGGWPGMPQLSLHKDIPDINLQWAQSCQVNRLSGTDAQKSQTEGFFTKACEGDILYSIFFFLYCSSGPLLPLPHPELKFVSLLNYFKKCTACPLRHRKLHLMVYCIRISIFRQKSTDAISGFLSPILLIFASFCIAWSAMM